MSTVLRSYKPRKCRQCGDWFTPARPLQPVCGVPCAILFSREQKAKKVKREATKAKRAWRERTKSIGQRLSEADRAFGAWVRWRDRNEACICCPDSIETGWQGLYWNAGHYKPKGSNAALRFDEKNVHKQRVQCNKWKSGNLTDYRQGLIRKIGLSEVERLEGPQPSVKWDHDELIAIKAEYSRRLREAKRE